MLVGHVCPTPGRWDDAQREAPHRPDGPRDAAIKSWLALSRNQTRDYLDIAALADHLGIDVAATTLRGIDDDYGDLNQRDEAVATQLVRRLADPRPRDHAVTRQLSSYKELDPRWHDWTAVTAVLRQLAQEVLR